jgi:hypothetical protein
MAMNPNSLMADLRMKSDKELQQFAAMHKNDPFIFPLAFQESQTRQRMRMAQQAQMGGQEQPKVVDQELAQMMPQAQQLPEDSGIAQLPAKNIEGMAGGGIVAFEEGGEVPSFSGTEGSQVRGISYAPYGFANTLAAQPTQAEIAEFNRQQEQGFTGNLQEFLGKIRNALPSFDAQQLSPTQKKKTIQYAEGVNMRPTMANDPRRLDLSSSENAAGDKETAEDADKQTAGANKGKTGAGAAGVAGLAGAAGAGGGNGKAPSTDTALNTALNAATGVEALLPAKRKAREKDEFLAEREDISKPVYEKAEKMINKEKDRLNEGKEQDFYMALIEGGLAAAGATGTNALQNIAQGFSKGVGSYGRALKDFRKAAQENSKMELEMERARAAEKRNDIDAYQRHMETVENQNADIDKLKTSGLFQLANTNLSGQYQLKASANSAAAQIAAAKLPGAQERLFSTLGGGDVNKGLKIFQEAQADKTGAAYAKLYADYSANAAKNGIDAMSPIEFAQNMQQFMGAMQGGGFQSKPSGNAVRTLPGN